MATAKTQVNDVDPQAFVEAVEHPVRRKDGLELLGIMTDITGEKPRMWGPSIIGFGSYHYIYESGREGDWLATGFSPRKQALTLYIMGGFSDHEALMERLGKYKTGRACLYINKLDDIHRPTLKKTDQKELRPHQEKVRSIGPKAAYRQQPLMVEMPPHKQSNTVWWIQAQDQVSAGIGPIREVKRTAGSHSLLSPIPADTGTAALNLDTNSRSNP
ncbi:MAG: DUF1801 domain-containing protein [Lysobacterales bacterium]